MMAKSFKRSSDSKLFNCDLDRSGYYLVIVSADGEEDLIKWCGADYFVSLTRGFSYVMLPQVQVGGIMLLQDTSASMPV